MMNDPLGFGSSFWGFHEGRSFFVPQTHFLGPVGKLYIFPLLFVNNLGKAILQNLKLLLFRQNHILQINTFEIAFIQTTTHF